MNTKIISWKDGKVVEIDPYTIRLEEDKWKESGTNMPLNTGFR